MYVALNAHHFEVQAALPPPPQGSQWARLVDTAMAVPKDFTPGTRFCASLHSSQAKPLACLPAQQFHVCTRIHVRMSNVRLYNRADLQSFDRQ